MKTIVTAEVIEANRPTNSIQNLKNIMTALKNCNVILQAEIYSNIYDEVIFIVQYAFPDLSHILAI